MFPPLYTPIHSDLVSFRSCIVMDTAASAAPGAGTAATSAGTALLLFPDALYHTDHGYGNQQQNNYICKHFHHLSPNHLLDQSY